MNVNAPFWNRGWNQVPGTTGASALMDGSDIEALAEAMGFDLPFGSVLDVGCGTGRAAQLCDEYLGCDVAIDAVCYCEQNGIKAVVIEGAADLPKGTFDVVLCLSVFTHIDRDERIDYLKAFAKKAKRLLVDIIPGDGGGEVAKWTADPDQFLADLKGAGFSVEATAARPSPEGVPHTYYWAVRA